LRILHLVGGAGWRGRERQVMALAAGLKAKRHDVVLAARAGSPMATRAAGEGVAVAPLPRGPGALWSLRRLLATGPPWNILHAHDPAALRALGWAGGGAGARRVLTVGGDIGYGRRAAPPGARRGDLQLFAVSEWVWSSLVRAGVPEERIAVVHTGIDPDRFRPPDAARRREARERLAIEPDDLAVGSVMHLTRSSGAATLVEAMRRMRGRLTQGGMALILIGDGPERARLDESCAQGGVAGFLPGEREDVPALLAAADVYVHPAAKGDGFPIALREAMAMALPVVATDLMGIREIIDNGKHGLIVPGEDPEALALNILRLQRDPEYARRLGKAGSLKVQRYSLRSMIDRTEELYFRLIR